MNNQNINTNPEVEAEVIVENDVIYNSAENKARRETMFGRLFQEEVATSSALDKLFS